LLGTAIAQARFAASVGLGVRHSPRALESIISGLQASLREFGPADREVSAAVEAPLYTPDERRQMQLSRVRRQARRAAEDVPYYADLFRRLALDPRRLSWQEFERIPLTGKLALRQAPEDFVSRRANPVLTVETTGTTGPPTRVAFSYYELAVMRSLGAIGAIVGGLIADDDVLLIATCLRAIGSLNIAASAARIGAHVRPLGTQDPQAMLAALSTRRRVPQHAERPTLLSANPSYLGMLAEAGIAAGLGPGDFGLRRVFTGGELVTAGLRAGLVDLFGEIHVEEGYALTETLPFAARLCSQSHLHFESTHGLLELIDPSTGRTADPGALATIVATPLPPLRETTLLLRYDTEDVVRAPALGLDCELRHQPATSAVQGKLGACARLDDGHLIAPRPVAEALEASRYVPLPARFGLRSCGADVGIDAVVRDQDDSRARRDVAARLLDAGVPVGELRLLDDPRSLRRAMPLRGDLRESTFQPPAAMPQEVIGV
jgi:phenylacetate-coenzyme A ligase PaaK-like adenylate-forming protein